MAKYFYFTLLVAFIFSLSCSQEADLFDNEKLADILTDMHIAEVAIKRSSNELNDSIQNLYWENLERIHKVDREEIKRQVELLNYHRERQSEIYSLVTQKLQAIEKEIKYQKEQKDNTRFNK